MPTRLLLPLVVLGLLVAAAPAPAATRLPSAPVVSAWLRATGAGGELLAGGRRVAVPRGGAVRLETIRTGSRVRIALGERRWRGPARGGIRLRGPVRPALVLGTVRTPEELIAHRLLALEPALRGTWAPDGSAPNGRIRRTRDWKRGFYAGALWRAIQAAPGTRSALEPVAWRATRALWGGEGEDTHDVGFIFGESSYLALTTGCATGGRRCKRAGDSVYRAALTLSELARTTPAGVIPVQAKAGCRICQGDERKVYIDSAMNLLTLLLRSPPGALDVVRNHLGFLSREMVRPDGSTVQQVLVSANTGAVTRRLGHDPLSAGSTWARGQGWAVHGLVDMSSPFREPWVIELAQRTADWAAAHAAGVPGWDWSRPVSRRNPADTSAAAIGAAGLAKAVNRFCPSIAPPEAAPEQCAAWHAASERLLAAALRHVSSRPGELGRFDGQRYLWDPSRRIDYRGEYLMGTDYLLEALARSRGTIASATSRSTASGR